MPNSSPIKEYVSKITQDYNILNSKAAEADKKYTSKIKKWCIGGMLLLIYTVIEIVFKILSPTFIYTLEFFYLMLAMSVYGMIKNTNKGLDIENDLEQSLDDLNKQTMDDLKNKPQLMKDLATLIIDEHSQSIYLKLVDSLVNNERTKSIKLFYSLVLYTEDKNRIEKEKEKKEFLNKIEFSLEDSNAKINKLQKKEKLMNML